MLERADIEDVVRALRERHGCHMAILYGSYARGDATRHSDLDIAGFAPVAKAARIAGPWRGTWLDAFVHPETMLLDAGVGLLSLRGGVVLFERDGEGARLLRQLDEVFERGPQPLTEDEIAARRQWAWKMLERAARGDVEGNFRRAWLLTAVIEDWFLERRLWYLGPKSALAYLRIHAPDVHTALEAALEPGAGLTELETAVALAAGPRTTLSPPLI